MGVEVKGRSKLFFGRSDVERRERDRLPLCGKGERAGKVGVDGSVLFILLEQVKGERAGLLEA